MENITTRTIRDIALAAPATTRVFEEFNIDYCCGGRRSIADACEAAGIDRVMLEQRLDEVIGQPVNVNAPETSCPSELIWHILATHHVFTAEETTRLIPLMDKVVTRHGELHPELYELQSVFTALVDSLIPHMKKEENVLFPYIEQLEKSLTISVPPPMPHFGTVQNPVRMMMADHDSDGERLRKMRRITNDYTLPEGVCPSFTALYAGLEDLERDLHRHIHLENNVLFPAAVKLESDLASRLGQGRFGVQE